IEHKDTALVAKAGGEFETLPLTAGQRRERLAKGEVAKADIDHALEDRGGRRSIGLAFGEQGKSVGHRHLEHIGDRGPAQGVVEDVFAEASTLARLAHGRDGLHHTKLSEDETRAIADGTGTL